MTIREFLKGIIESALTDAEIIRYCEVLDKDLLAELVKELWMEWYACDGVGEWQNANRLRNAYDLICERFNVNPWEASPEPQQEQVADAQSLNTETEQAPPEPQQKLPEPTAPTILTIWGTDKEKMVFGNALQKQYMSLDNGCYKWTLSKSLLAYMCGRLYCGDRIKEDENDYSEEYVKGNTQMPAKEVMELFGRVDVASNRYSLKAPPRNHYKIDELFKNNGTNK